LPSGLILTVLVVNNYYKSDRDDSSFARTVRNIRNQLLTSPIIVNPVNSREFLSDHITETQMSNFKERLSVLLDNANLALKEESKERACKLWKAEFGHRFPKCEGLEGKDAPLRTSAPAILRNDARSA